MSTTTEKRSAADAFGLERSLASHCAADNRRDGQSFRPMSKEQAPVETPLIDKFGRRYTIHVLTTWSPRALEAMGVRPINTGSEEEAPSAMR